jgi:sphingolipid delta-4 desaturase
MVTQETFAWSDKPEPHRIRTKEIINKYPNIRELIGRNSATVFVVLLAVGIQFTLAWYLQDKAWWWALIAAYAVGAFACHTLFVCIHECAHNLIFKNRSLNTIAGIVANLPLVFPSSVSFQKYHL